MVLRPWVRPVQRRRQGGESVGLYAPFQSCKRLLLLLFKNRDSFPKVTGDLTRWTAVKNKVQVTVTGGCIPRSVPVLVPLRQCRATSPGASDADTAVPPPQRVSARRQSLPAGTEGNSKITNWGQNITGIFVPLLDSGYLFSHALRLNKIFFKKKNNPCQCPALEPLSVREPGEINGHAWHVHLSD